jgi:hypothetical protein
LTAAATTPGAVDTMASMSAASQRGYSLHGPCNRRVASASVGVDVRE